MSTENDTNKDTQNGIDTNVSIIKEEPLRSSPNLIKQHCQLLTSDFKKSLVPHFEKSKWVGYSCFLIIIPIFFIPGKGIFANFLRMLCLFQIPIAYFSDYIYAPDYHIIHGIDRVTATICLLMFISITIYYNSFF